MKNKSVLVIGIFSLLALASVMASLIPVETEKLTASVGSEEALFGEWVAIDGRTAIISAYGEEHFMGSAYIFQEDQTGWTEVARLTAGDASVDDEFSFNVSIDGNTAVITAPQDDDLGPDSGSAYIFGFDGSNWVEQAKLTADDGAAGDFFGYASAVQGRIAVVTAIDDDAPGINAGSAYVFHRSGSVWQQVAKLTASDGQPGDGFGESVAIDGGTIVVGARYADNVGPDSGAAYVFRRKGANWVEVAKLSGSELEAYDHFGIAVAIEGNTIAVSAQYDGDNGTNAGAVYIFRKSRTGWIEETKLIASDGEAFEEFGTWQLDLYHEYLIVGAMRVDDLGDVAGGAYLFQRINGQWSETAKITASDGAAFDAFGLGVGIDGDTIIIGAGRDDDGGTESGSAYIFKLVNPPYP